MSLSQEVAQARWELVALALVLGAHRALHALPPQAAQGIIEALSNGEGWHPERKRRRQGSSTPRP